MRHGESAASGGVEVHARRDRECLEVAVVTQGRTLDEAVASLREALTSPLHKQLDVGTLQAIVRQAARFIPESAVRKQFYRD